MTREPLTDLERAAIAQARDFLERRCWASVRGVTILDVRHAVAVHLRGKSVNGQTVRVEVLLRPDGRTEGPRLLRRREQQRTARRAWEGRAA